MSSTTTKENKLDKLAQEYFNGRYIEALQQLTVSPDYTYEMWEDDSPFSRCFIHYLDALTHGGHQGRLFTNHYLMEQATEQQKANLNWEHVLISLFAASGDELYDLKKMLVSKEKPDPLLMAIVALRETGVMEEQQIEELAETYGPLSSVTVRTILRYYVASQEIKRTKRGWLDVVTESNEPPLFPLSYLGDDITVVEEGMPVIQMTPICSDWNAFVDQLAGRNAILLFANHTHFWSCLQFPELVPILTDRKNLLLILREPIVEQITAQRTFRAKDVRYDGVEPVVARLLERVLCGDHDASATLQNVCRDRDDRIGWKRLGCSRQLAFFQSRYYMEVERPYTGQRPKDEEDLIGKALSTYEKPRTHRYQKKPKMRVAHIAPQLVDHNHSPSLTLETFFRHHNRDNIEPYLFISEAHVYSPQDYPVPTLCSSPSLARAPNRIREFQELGVKIDINPTRHSLDQTVRSISQKLEEAEIDVAVFHGSDLVNLAIACHCDVPCRTYYQLSRHLQYPGFDLWVLPDRPSAWEEIQRKEWGTETATLAFPLARQSDLEEAPDIHTLIRAPKEAKLFTTISHHLEKRVNKETTWAIANILKRCPNAYYTPIGPISDPQEFHSRFVSYGVADRVVGIGEHENPAVIAQAATLYLNEFPEGSGFGLVDGMAAGCPVVSMYDPTGPETGKGGALYFGEERCVKSKEEYVDLACKLLQDSSMYQEWKTYTAEQYLKITDAKGTIRQFEETMDQWLQQR